MEYLESSKRGKEARLKEKAWREKRGLKVEERKKRKGVALQTSPATCRYPGVTGLFPGPPEKGGLELRPKTRILVLCQEEVIVSNPQLRLRLIDQIPACRTSVQENIRIG